ncbi:4'-phosphopantetheinyl transferase superfamily protein [Sphingomonas sp. SUN019]|uniref:4'-phosphopantetheinyl transferase family protein n=1 Tax=Sphingomonas sp. SUN019 TaxID=2937788 RepID=UPI0021645FE6|nr:4'-phosphopantetheinyl transferase superfamily protein [Sphingomonas sp. SUN019]UVO51486.1 4'-phosphopantetheinyl transferase superfamily protein [Sphingomonas sp. SUN019]
MTLRTVDADRRIRAIECAAPLSLWLLDLTIAPSADERAWLSPFEVERAARFHAERDRARYVAAHVGLRIVVAATCGIDAAAQRYVRGVHGKWRLTDRSPCRFNLSYAGDIALIGIAEDHEIGVDVEVERVVDDADALAAMYFNAREYDTYRKAGSSPAAFLGAWTRKEACLKALGVGLQLPPIELDTGLSGDCLVVHGGSRIDVGSLRIDGLVAAWARVR